MHLGIVWCLLLNPKYTTVKRCVTSKMVLDLVYIVINLGIKVCGQDFHASKSKKKMTRYNLCNDIDIWVCSL